MLMVKDMLKYKQSGDRLRYAECVSWAKLNITGGGYGLCRLRKTQEAGIHGRP